MIDNNILYGINDMLKRNLPLLVGSLLGITLFLIALFGILAIPDLKTSAKPTTVLNITPFLPTATSFLSEDNAMDQKAVQETSLPGVFANDMQVRVYGTGGDGLKVHNEPNIKSDTLTIAPEDSIWIIIEGPIIHEGRIWWKIWSDSTGYTGWAVQDYLTVDVQ